MAIGNRSLNVAGERYGRLVAVRRLRVENRQWVWEFQCDCGNSTEITIARVRYGNKRSCGCLLREHAKTGSVTHGHAINGISPTYRSWRAAKSRCFNPNWGHYDRYGGRGITMCARWVESFANFLADMGEKPAGTSLDRIDNDGDYTPENCRWATLAEQHANKTGVMLIEHEGKTLNLAQYARARGVSYSALWSRVRQNWPNPIEAADAIIAKERRRPSPQAA